MRGELVALHRRLGSTMIYVTHDQVEAMTMADQIVVLREGVVEQAGSPIELYARPANRFVAGFLGAPQMNFVEAKVDRRNGDFGLTLGDGVSVALPGRDVSLPDGAPVTAGIRPEHAEIGSGPLKVASRRRKSWAPKPSSMRGCSRASVSRWRSAASPAPRRATTSRSRCPRPSSICSTTRALRSAPHPTGAATM